MCLYNTQSVLTVPSTSIYHNSTCFHQTFTVELKKHIVTTFKIITKSTLIYSVLHNLCRRPVAQRGVLGAKTEDIVWSLRSFKYSSKWFLWLNWRDFKSFTSSFTLPSSQKIGWSDSIPGLIISIKVNCLISTKSIISSKWHLAAII